MSTNATKRVTLNNMNTNDSVKVGFTGSNGDSMTVSYRTNKWYLTRPGTQSVTFSLKKKGDSFHISSYVKPNQGPGTGGCYVHNLTTAPTIRFTDTGNTYRSYDFNTTKSPNQPPTYLETLDKLDQWTSAQYIPSRNV